MPDTLPVVAVSTDLLLLCGHPSYAIGQKYADPLLELAGCLPLLLPALGQRLPLPTLLQTVDGLLLSGSPSNIEPHHYGQAPDRADSPADPERDATTLPLVRAAIAAGVPLFGICRGFQEINVALGGSLLQQVHATPGYADHREDASSELAQQYGPAHSVNAVPGGWLEQLLERPSWSVNSVHGQGIQRLADALLPQALAPDGLIEAYTLRHGPGFVLGVQWHPEWQAAANPVSRRLFAAFGQACRQRAARRRGAGDNGTT